MEKDFTEPSVEEVDKLYFQLDKDAKQGGYNLNPDADFVRGLIKGLLTNEKRYGYRACPCRLASGEKCFYACRGSKDPNELLVWCEWDTTARMKKFAKSRELRQAMKGAGVISKPEVSFYSKMEAVNAS